MQDRKLQPFGHNLVTTRLYLIKRECLGRESNPHAPRGAPDFKSGTSASSATQANFGTNYLAKATTFFSEGCCEICCDSMSAANDGSSETASRFVLYAQV